MGVYKSGRPCKYWPDSNKGNVPPKLPGEYRIRDNNGTVTYIGETNNLYRRMGEHKRYGKLANGLNNGGSFEWMKADGRSCCKTRREHEKSKIKKHNPELNRSSGGEGRPSKRW